MNNQRVLFNVIADAVAIGVGIGLAWLIHMLFPHHCPWRTGQRARLRRWLRQRRRAGRA